MSDRPVLVARLSGGLGNQMFIYAAARRLAHVSNAELALDMTNGFIRDPYERFYQLDWFKLTAREATRAERLQPFNKFRRKLAKRRDAAKPYSDRAYIKQDGVAFDAALVETRISRTTYLEGYWQGDRYFNDVAELIRQDFELARKLDDANTAMRDTIQAQATPVALHVRFFAPPGAEESDNATLNYYRNAMRELEKHIANPHYFIFSDRPAAAQDMLALEADRSTLVTHNNTAETAPFDMWLMSQCRHFIIANSTFSWWGAWLGAAADKRVYAPALTTDVVGKYASWGFDGLLPEDWTTVALA